MAGLNLSGGLSGGYGGVAPAPAAQYGSAMSYGSGMGAVSSAFAGPSTNPTPTMGQMIAPTHGFGMATWLGITSIVLLVAIRKSLPN